MPYRLHIIIEEVEYTEDEEFPDAVYDLSWESGPHSGQIPPHVTKEFASLKDAFTALGCLAYVENKWHDHPSCFNEECRAYGQEELGDCPEEIEL